MPGRAVLIDGSSLIYRAWFAIPRSFATSGGLPTNATYGFATMFRKLMAGKTPDAIAMVFDAPGRTFRDERYPAYKAQRPRMDPDLEAQLVWIDRVVQVHRCPVLRVTGYEADDVIGTLTRLAREAGHEVHIISGDKDFAQLIGPGVRMVDTMRDLSYDEELVRKKWGVRPDQFVDYLALLGDKVDNIPGVPGIGAKGAAELLERFGTLDGVLGATDQLKGRQQGNLEQFREQALLSRELATIDVNVPLEQTLADLAFAKPEADAVNALYRELEFFSLLSDDAVQEARRAEGDFGTCTSLDEVEEALAGDGPLGLFPVYDGSAMEGSLVGLAVAGGPDRARYVPASLDGAMERVGRALASGRTVVVHELRTALCVLERHGLRIDTAVDTALASFLIDPTGLIPHGLAQVARQFVQRTLPPAKDVQGSGQALRPFAALDPAAVGDWACLQAAAVAAIWPVQEPILTELGQRAHLDEVDLPLARVLAGMQLAGIRVDGPDLDRMGEEFEERKIAIEARIYELAGHEFNIGSTQQLATVLFEELGLPVIKRTKTGYSTDADVLERLAADHEIASAILEQRALAKLINTYTRVLREALSEKTGRVHCTIQQTVGASGRLITTDPDLQRTPIRTPDGKRIRRAFLPAPGQVLISADWSQIELRILAHVSADPLLVEAFSTGVDVHRRTAAQIFDVDPAQVTPEQRSMGKTVNFATIYGQGATALGQQLGLKRKDAQQMIDRYFAAYAGVRTWLDGAIAEGTATGSCRTLLGRRRLIPELSSNNWSDKAYGERIAANTPIQGSAADICKLAMLQIDERLRAEGLQTRMLLQIHDELLFEAPPDEVDAAVAIIRDRMEHCIELKVPLVVDIGTGASWAEAH